MLIYFKSGILTKPIGGLMLAVSFWTMAKVGETSSLIRYLIISGYGILLLFASNQALLLAVTPYPSFGLSTVTFIGFAAYLTLEGVYSSIVLISRDAELRKSIRKLASSQLSDSMASAEMQKEIEYKVSMLLDREYVEMQNETGLSPSLTRDEARQDLENVLKGTQKVKNQ